MLVINIYFIGDIHGDLDALKSVFRKVPLDSGEFYFVGDYIDRGLKSKEVVSYLRNLDKQQDNVHFIKGNHEQMMIDFYLTGDAQYLKEDRRLSTLKSFFPSRKMFFDGFSDILTLEDDSEITNDIRKELSSDEDFKWLMELPLFFETEKQIIVHAGVNKTLDNWKETSEETFLWKRPDFDIPNRTGKTIIAGHTPTISFHRIYHETQYEQPNIYFSKATNEIFIDTINFEHGNARILKYCTDSDEYSEIV